VHSLPAEASSLSAPSRECSINGASIDSASGSVVAVQSVAAALVHASRSTTGTKTNLRWILQLCFKPDSFLKPVLWVELTQHLPCRAWMPGSNGLVCLNRL